MSFDLKFRYLKKWKKGRKWVKYERYLKIFENTAVPGKKSIPSFPPPIPRFLPRKPGGISNREKKKTDSFHGNSNKLHDRSHSQPPETRLRIRAIGWWAVWGGRTEGSSPEGNDLWPTSQPWYCYPFPWTAAKYSISTNLSPLALQILYLYHLSLSLSLSLESTVILSRYRFIAAAVHFGDV